MDTLERGIVHVILPTEVSLQIASSNSSVFNQYKDCHLKDLWLSYPYSGNPHAWNDGFCQNKSSVIVIRRIISVLTKLLPHKKCTEHFTKCTANTCIQRILIVKSHFLGIKIISANWRLYALGFSSAQTVYDLCLHCQCFTLNLFNIP